MSPYFAFAYFSFTVPGSGHAFPIHFTYLDSICPSTSREKLSPPWSLPRPQQTWFFFHLVYSRSIYFICCHSDHWLCFLWWENKWEGFSPASVPALSGSVHTSQGFYHSGPGSSSTSPQIRSGCVHTSVSLCCAMLSRLVVSDSLWPHGL